MSDGYAFLRLAGDKTWAHEGPAAAEIRRRRMTAIRVVNREFTPFAVRRLRSGQPTSDDRF